MRRSPFQPRLGDSGPWTASRFLDQFPRTVEGAPDADLAAPVERPRAHQRPVGPVEDPGAVHLAVAVEAFQLHHTVDVMLDVRDWRIVLCHGATIANVRPLGPSAPSGHSH